MTGEPVLRRRQTRICIDEFLEELRHLAEVKSLTLSDQVCVAWAIQALALTRFLLDHCSVEMLGSECLVKDLQQELGWKTRHVTRFRKCFVLAHLIGWVM